MKCKCSPLQKSSSCCLQHRPISSHPFLSSCCTCHTSFKTAALSDATAPSASPLNAATAPAATPGSFVSSPPSCCCSSLLNTAICVAPPKGPKPSAPTAPAGNEVQPILASASASATQRPIKLSLRRSRDRQYEEEAPNIRTGSQRARCRKNDSMKTICMLLEAVMPCPLLLNATVTAPKLLRPPSPPQDSPSSQRSVCPALTAASSRTELPVARPRCGTPHGPTQTCTCHAAGAPSGHAAFRACGLQGMRPSGHVAFRACGLQGMFIVGMHTHVLNQPSVCLRNNFRAAAFIVLSMTCQLQSLHCRIMRSRPVVHSITHRWSLHLIGRPSLPGGPGHT